MAERQVKITGVVGQNGVDVEQALEELKDMINRKAVTNYIPFNPVDNLQFFDEETDTLYVFNTSTKEWVAIN
jgi:hypothetical protein